jgi:uncharacterized membrane protein
MSSLAARELRPVAAKLLLGAMVVVSAHLAILADGISAATILLYAYFAALVGFAALRAGGPYRVGLGLISAACLAVVGLTAWAEPFDGATALVLPPLLGYGLVSLYFAESLLLGRTPAILKFARIAHPEPLPLAVEHYARRLTWAWAVLPASLAAASLLVLAGDGLASWSWVCNVINPSIMLSFFLGEHAYRYRRFPVLGPPSLAGTFRAIFKAHVR